jgi:DNA-binding LytR/AlgR family response regulator
LFDYFNNRQEIDVFLLAKDENLNIKINVKDIIHLEAADNYVKIHLLTEVYKKRISLTDLEERLEKYGIIRVHRSYAVNKYNINELAHAYSDDYIIRLKNGRIILTSRNYREKVRLLMQDSC